MTAAWFSLTDSAQIERFLRDHGWVAPHESIARITRAGLGNMNLTLRVDLGTRSFIVKQSRPWVEKYPTIEAPVERAWQEIRFYQTVTDYPNVAARMPRLIGVDPTRYVLLLQDLGDVPDCSYLYHPSRSARLTKDLIENLVDWLAALHQIRVPAEGAPQWSNRSLRQLNSEHMYIIPFLPDPVLDLDAITPGLASLQARLCRDGQLAARCQELRRLYLQDGHTLIHGDYFPGSWLWTDEGLKIIDPEFSFLGRGEFDWAILVAHLQLMGIEPTGPVLRQRYEGRVGPLDWGLVEKWSAMEILRRLWGVAQLPLERTLEEKRALIDGALAILH